MLISFDDIWPCASDGLNRSNFDSEFLFEDMKGEEFVDIAVIHETKKRWNGNSSHVEKREKVTWKLNFKGKSDLYIRQGYDDWFRFGMTMPHCHAGTAGIQYKRAKKAAILSRQVPIVEGRGSGGCFWIVPIRHTSSSSDAPDGLIAHEDQKISIDDDYIHEFLSPFLIKYFDPTYPCGHARPPYDPPEYDPYSTNIYTYSTMEIMLREIEQTAHLLATDYDNPKLTDLKKKFNLYTFAPEIENRYSLSKAEQEAIIKERIDIALDFYERFIARMRKMINVSGDYTAINFEGP